MENDELNKKNDEKKTKSKIVPSYIKKDGDTKKVKKDKVQLKSKITKILLILIIVLVLASIVTGIYFFIDSFKYKVYKEYESQIKAYGFDKMYNNQSCNSSDKVTQSEAIKLIVSTAFNEYDISSFAPVADSKYPNEIWVKYAEFKEIIPKDVINKDNENKKIKLIDAINYLYEAKRKILKKDFDKNDEVKLSDYKKYNSDQQFAIQDMTWNKIIENNTGKLKGKSYLFKGKFNQMLIFFAERYNTITLGDQKINISNEKLPYNVEEYPYTLANVKKEVYETRYFYTDELKSILPSQMYITSKDRYKEYVYKTEKYLNTILNIDYTTIDEALFKSVLNSVSITEINSDDVKAYIDYVKQNKIKITGVAKVQLPAIYYDGTMLRVRTLVNYKVVSADNLKNVLFMDNVLKSNFEYKLEEKSQIYDIGLCQYEDTKSYFVSMGCLNNLVAGKVKKMF